MRDAWTYGGEGEFRPRLSSARPRWSLRLGSLFGVDVYLHATFLLLVGLVALSELWGGAGWVEVFWSFLATFALFGVVVLHELGHALMARRFGVRTRDITLYPIGGVARLEAMPRHPVQELLIALAGPAVNAGLALVAVAAFFGVSVLSGPAELLWWFVVLNVVLAVFNLMPAFPMDGGRVLRALLALRLPYVKATRVATTTGKVMAVAFGVLGFFFNPLLMVIAVFIYFAASAEQVAVEQREMLRRSAWLVPDQGHWSAWREFIREEGWTPANQVTITWWARRPGRTPDQR